MNISIQQVVEIPYLKQRRTGEIVSVRTMFQKIDHNFTVVHLQHKIYHNYSRVFKQNRMDVGKMMRTNDFVICFHYVTFLIESGPSKKFETFCVRWGKILPGQVCFPEVWRAFQDPSCRARLYWFSLILFFQFWEIPNWPFESTHMPRGTANKGSTRDKIYYMK